MKRADEARGVASPVAKAPAPVAADVVVRPDAVRGAHHDDRVAADVIDPVVAHLGNLLLPASHLPHAGPEPLHLQVVERLAGVAGHWHGDQRRAEDVLQGQGFRRRHHIPADQLLVANAFRTQVFGFTHELILAVFG